MNIKEYRHEQLILSAMVTSRTTLIMSAMVTSRTTLIMSAMVTSRITLTSRTTSINLELGVSVYDIIRSYFTPVI